jgi:hypothetical protein
MDTERLAALKGDMDLWHDAIARFEYSKSSEYDEHHDHEDFFETIAAFVGFILHTEELRDLLQEILRADESRLHHGRHTGARAVQLLQSVHQHVTSPESRIKNASKRFWYLSSAGGQPGKRVARDVYVRLRTALTNRTAKQTVIKRFRAYCELYKTRWLINEVRRKENEGKTEEVLQDFLEEYVFQQGYYPISQAQLGRGRLDALAYAPGEAGFLVEVKQAGFGNSNSQESIAARTAIQKIEEAINQAQSYQHRLTGIASGSDVYVVLFSARYLVFNDPLPIRRGGLSFFVEVVNLIDKPVTEWGNPVVLSLEQ